MSASEQTPDRAGLFDALARVLKVLLDSPRFRQTLTILLNELDPHNAPRLVQVLAETDPALALAALSAAPGLANAGIGSTAEALQRASALQPQMLKAFADQLVEQLDSRGLGRTAGLALLLAARLVDQKGLNQGDGALCGAFNRGFNQALQEQGSALNTLLPELIDVLAVWATRVAAALDADARKEDSTVVAAAGRMAAAIQRIAAENPALLERVARPLAQACSAALTPGDADER